MSIQANLVVYNDNVDSSIELWYTAPHGCDALYMQVVFEVFQVTGMGYAP